MLGVLLFFGGHADSRAWRTYAGMALALLCVVGCAARLGASDLRLHANRASEIAAEQAVPLLSLARPERSPRDVRGRAVRLAAILGHAPCRRSRVVAWASSVLVHAGAEPLVCGGGLVITYRADLDMLEAWTKVDGGAHGTVDRKEALRIAERFAHEMQRRGLIAGDWCSTGAGRVVEGRFSRSPAGERSRQRTRAHSFRYARCVEGIPLFDTLLDLEVDASGRVTRAMIADVLVRSMRIVRTQRSSSDAKMSMQSQADEYARSVSPRIRAHVQAGRVGYKLPKDTRSVEVGPRVWAEVVFRSEPVISSRSASVSLVDPVPELLTLD